MMGFMCIFTSIFFYPTIRSKNACKSPASRGSVYIGNIMGVGVCARVGEVSIGFLRVGVGVILSYIEGWNRFFVVFSPDM